MAEEVSSAEGGAPVRPAGAGAGAAHALSGILEGDPIGASLFTGLPPLLMLALGVIIGAAISFAIGVVVWSVFG